MKQINRYNEIEYAQQIEQQGFQTQFYKYELKLLAKYWKHIGIKPSERKKRLYEFCELHIDQFDQAIHYKLINSILAYSNKKTSVPIVIDYVPIYEHEFNGISSLPLETHYRKLLFAFLVEKKLRKEIQKFINKEEASDFEATELSLYLNVNNKLAKDLMQSAKIPSKLKFNSLIYELSNSGYVTVLEREMIRLDFLEQLADQSSAALIDIHYFSESGLYYELLNGDKKIRYCEHCQIIMKRKANNQTKCNDCQKCYRTSYINNKQKEKRKSFTS